MNRFLLLVFAVLIFSFNLSAQSSASAIWTLTANQTADITGNVTAPDQQLSNIQVTYSSGVQRSSPTPTAGTWPNESVENSSRYMQFVVSPAGGYFFNVTSINMLLYANSGSSMKANIYYSKDPAFTTRTQIGSTFSLTSTVPGKPNVTASPNISVDGGESIYVRIYPWYAGGTSGKYLIAKTVTVLGTTNSLTYLQPSVSDLNGFEQNSGTPSLTQTYTLIGTNLTNPVVVTPPVNYEISIDVGASWHNKADPVSLPVNGGIITGQPVTISVRMNASSPGEFNDTIYHTTAGASDGIVTVSGIFYASQPTVISTVSFGTVTGNSLVVNFNGGNGAKRVVVARTDSVVSWTPTDGIPVYDVNSNFSQALNQGNGNKAIYDGAGNSVTMTGLTSNKTYYIAVYEYNIASGNSQNYLTSTAATGNGTTLTVPELITDPVSLSFGNRVINKDTVVKSYTLTGNYLTGSGNISVSVPIGGFDVSLSPNSGFAPSVSVPYTSGTLNAVTIYVRFIPTSVSNYSDNITNSGGGSIDVKVSVSGKGVATLIETSTPVGFATLGGGTTGGQGGTSIIISDAATLVELFRLREKGDYSPLIIYISGTIAGYSTEISCKRTKNVSILGLGTDAGFTGFGIKVVECQNIIIRNMTFSDCHVDGKDGIEINSSSNVWVDHCSFTDSPANDLSGDNHDGELDTKVGSFNVTISYNHFQNHRKTCLLGHSPNETGDTAMTVTYFANWFDGTYSRHPRIRFARTHLLNNLYSNTGAAGGYGVGVTCNAQVQLEANYFENTPMPVLISLVNDPDGTLSNDPAGFIKSVNNYAASSGTIVENLGGYNFDPMSYYTYGALEASLVKSVVMDNAGAGILNISNPLPVELTTFTASVINNSAILNWSTATEVNNYGFEVQKKVNGSDFTLAGFVSGNGTSSTRNKYVFSDKLTGNEKQVSYRLKQIDLNGKFAYSKAVELITDIPKSYSLEQNYPNPFNPSTRIDFSLPVNSKVVIKLYNILGQQVGVLLNEELSAGRRQITLNASGYVSGVYFYTIEAAGNGNSIFKSVKKMILLK